MPSMNCAPRPAPRQRSPSAMHRPSPPSRTGTPANAPTRSTIGKRCHAVILMGLTVPACRSIGPARRDAHASDTPTGAGQRLGDQSCQRPPTPPLRRCPVSAAWRCAPALPSASTRPAAIFVPPMSIARARSGISACGCCRADGDPRDARSRGPARPGSAQAAVEPQPESAAAGRGAQVFGDRRAHLVQRRSVDGPAAPAVAIGRPCHKAQRVAGVVADHIGLGDVDRGGDAREHRAGQRVGQHRRGHAADLQPGRHVRQQLVLGRRSVGGQPAARPPPPRSRARSPAAGSASGAAGALAGARPRQRCRESGAAQPRLAGVDLVHRTPPPRRPSRPPGSSDRHLHRG